MRFNNITPMAVTQQRGLTSLHLAIGFAVCASAVFSAAAAEVPLAVNRTVGNAVRGVAISHQGDLLAVSGRGVSIWSVDGRAQRIHVDVPRNLRAVAFSGDDASLTAISDRGIGATYDVRTGAEIIGFRDPASVVAVGISPDASLVVTGTIDNELRFWRGNGRERYELAAVARVAMPAIAIAVSADRRFAAVACADAVVRIYSISSASLVQQYAAGQRVLSSVAISPTGDAVLAGSWDGSAYLWRDGKLRILDAAGGRVSAVALSGDGELSAIGLESSLTIWPRVGNRPVATLKTTASDHSFVGAMVFGKDGGVVAVSAGGTFTFAAGPEWRRTLVAPPYATTRRVATSPQGRWLAVEAGVSDETGYRWSTTLWDLAEGSPVRSFDGNSPFFVSEDVLGTVGTRNVVQLWDTTTGRLIRDLHGFQGNLDATPSSDGRRVVLSSRTELAVWQVSDGKLLAHAELAPQRQDAFTPRLSRSGNEVIVGFAEKVVFIDLSGGPSRELASTSRDLLIISPDEQTVAALGPSGDPRRIRVAQFGAPRAWETTLRSPITSASFSPSGARLVVTDVTGALTVFDTTSGTAIGEIPAEGASPAVTFTADDRFLVVVADHVARIFSGSEWAARGRLVTMNDSSWAVTDERGRYDASDPTRVDGVGWLLNGEVVALHRLRRNYYEPSLLATFFASPLQLRAVPPLSSLRRSPAPAVSWSASGAAKIITEDRGGGVGTIQVKLNGREVQRSRRDTSGPFTIDVSSELRRGGVNRLEVVASNADDTIASEPATASWTDPQHAEDPSPEAWILAIGTSDYASASMNLPYATTDASSLSDAFVMGAQHLFGPKHVHVRTIRRSDPTRAAVTDALQWLGKSRTEDVVIVYLAGHGKGIEHESDPDSDYWYFTSEAKSLAPAPTAGVGSTELFEQVRHLAALRQIWIVDTCAAASAQGAFARARLAAPARRAMAEYHDRTGFDVLFASTAFGPAFQSSLLRRSILSHALLTGLKGPALRGGQYIDVAHLFGYALDAVPRIGPRLCPADLTAGVPQILQMDGGSFDAGRLSASERDRIALGASRPFLSRPQFLGGNGVDDLRLSAAVARLLKAREVAEDTPALFLDDDVDDDDLLEPSGSYVIYGDEVSLFLQIRRGGKTAGETDLVIDRSSVDLAEAVVEAIDALVRNVCGHAP